MKSFIVFAAALALAHADVSHLVGKESDYAAQILRSDLDINADGQFQYAYETSNGIASQAQGSLKNVNSEAPILEVKGQSSWTAPDGTPVQLTYIADENGYQPSGNILPVGPPIPEAILRSLKYIEEHAPVDRAVNPAQAFARSG